MKIGLVRRGYSPTGGAEAYLCRLAAGLLDAGHLPVLIGSSEWPEGIWPGDEVVRVPGGSPVEFARNVGRAAGGCDVIFSLERIFECDIYRAGDGVHVAWLERRARFEPAWRGWLRRWNRKHAELIELERRVFDSGRTRFVIANSEMVREEIVRIYEYPAERIIVVRNGVDGRGGNELRRNAGEAPAHAGGAPAVPEAGEAPAHAGEAPEVPGTCEGREITALFAGSGWERKGLRFAIEAARGMTGLRLVVAGKGKLRGLRRERVECLGPVREMGPVYAGADLFVLPTLYDPFANACLEALAAGLPVITTSANGFAEIIEPGVHGEVVEPGDVDGLRRALGGWCDRGRIETARTKCRELAARYSVAENVRGTLDVIGRVVES
jgi:UDP-glucose:(heptosyl)LPS alpha-1,3-glucosyltransferase